MESSVGVTIAATLFFTLAAAGVAAWLWVAQSRKK